MFILCRTIVHKTLTASAFNETSMINIFSCGKYCLIYVHSPLIFYVVLFTLIYRVLQHTVYFNETNIGGKIYWYLQYLLTAWTICLTHILLCLRNKAVMNWLGIKFRFNLEQNKKVSLRTLESFQSTVWRILCFISVLQKILDMTSSLDVSCQSKLLI